MSARAFRRVFASLPRSLSTNVTPLSRAASKSALRPSIPAIRQFSSSSRSQATYVQFGGKRRPSYIPGRDPKEWYIIGAIGFAGGVYYYIHLETVPETGRTRFMNVTSKREKQLAKEMSRVIMQEYGNRMLPANHPVTKHVTDIVRRIVTSSGLGIIHGDPTHAVPVGSDFNDGLQDHRDPRLRVDVGTQSDSPAAKTQEWTVYVVQDATPNAFTTFGGYVVVFTGILPVAANDDGLAAVVAHELAHVVARHPSEQLSGQSIWTGIAWVAEVFGIAPTFLTNTLSQLLLKLPNSRTQEYEADQIGLKLMARACFDPREAQQMFRRLHEASGGGGKLTEFISTHPYGPNRVEALEVQMAAAYEARSENAECSNMQGLRGALNNLVGGGQRRPPRPEQPRPLPPPRTSGETWREGDSSEFVLEGRSDGREAWK